MHIVSVDVGLVHLAYVLVRVNKVTMEIVKVLEFDLVDLRRLPCLNSKSKCPYGDQKTHSHYIYHFIKRKKIMFDHADVILVERQPPSGFNSIEQLIQFHYPEKTTLMSPNALHSYLEIRDLDYDDRKTNTEEIAAPFLNSFPKYLQLERKHDVADAICFILFYLHKQKVGDMDLNPFKSFVFDNKDLHVK